MESLRMKDLPRPPAYACAVGVFNRLAATLLRSACEEYLLGMDGDDAVERGHGLGSGRGPDQFSRNPYPHNLHF